jgi:hypothetical protein
MKKEELLLKLPVDVRKKAVEWQRRRAARMSWAREMTSSSVTSGMHVAVKKVG